jgi:hypothetical protein
VRAGKFFGEGSLSYRVNGDGSIFVGATGQGVAPGGCHPFYHTKRAEALARMGKISLAAPDLEAALAVAPNARRTPISARLHLSTRPDPAGGRRGTKRRF